MSHKIKDYWGALLLAFLPFLAARHNFVHDKPMRDFGNLDGRIVCIVVVCPLIIFKVNLKRLFRRPCTFASIATSWRPLYRLAPFTGMASSETQTHARSCELKLRSREVLGRTPMMRQAPAGSGWPNQGPQFD